MKYPLLIFSFFALTGICKAQEIRVLDAANKNHISNVLIYGENYSITTDNNGVGDISRFAKHELLRFQHPSYHEFAIIKQNIATERTIYLTEKIIHIEEVVVSANRWEQDLEKVPQKILSIGKNAVEKEQPQTSADLLEATGQVFVQKSQLGGGSPMLRGFAANNILLVVDGVRMNNAIYRSGNLQNVINIDPLSLEGTEVIFGPGSVMYGSDALGGVIDFHTVTPTFSKEKPELSGRGLLRYSTAAAEKTGHVDITFSLPVFSFFSSTTFTAMNDLRAGSNYMSKYPDFGKKTFLVRRTNGMDKVIENSSPEIQSPSGYNLFSTINKARYRYNSLDITYSLYYSTTNDIPRYDRLVEVDGNNLPVYAEWYYGPQRWMMNSLKAALYEQTKFFDQARFILANQQISESRFDRRFNNNLLRSQSENVDVWNANFDFEKQLSDVVLYYGIEAVTNFVSSEAERTNIITAQRSFHDSRYPSNGSTWNSYAIYSSMTKEIKKFSLSGGLRYSYITLLAGSTDNNVMGRQDVHIKNGALTGSVGAVYKANDNLRIRTNFSNGFRAPNVDDVGKVFEVSGNSLSVPNKNLKPQFTYSGELGIGYFNSKWLVDLTGFGTLVDQVMVRSPFTINGESTFISEDGSVLQVVALTNAGKASIYGATLSLGYEVTRHLGLTSHFTFSEGFEGDGTPLRHVPPSFGKVDIDYRNKNLEVSFVVDYNLQKSSDRIPLIERASKPHLYTRDGNIPAWYTLNLQTACYFKNGFTGRINIENILDLHYRTFSSGISSPGRNFSFTLSKSF